MPPPPVTIYITSLTSTAKVRQQTELLHRSLRGLEIPYESFDLVMDSDAKTRWQRAKPPGVVVGLPGYLVGGEWVGTMDDFELAVESGTLPTFLKQDLDVTGGTIQQTELENLMRGMSEADIDALVGELGHGPVGKVGLLVPAGAEPEPKPEPETAAEAPTANLPGGSNGIAGALAGAASTIATSAGAGIGGIVGAVDETPSPEDRRKSAEIARFGMTKEDMAEAMKKADTVEGLLALTERAEGKEKVD